MEVKYVYANVRIPLEVTGDTYRPLKEYIDVTFQECKENFTVKTPRTPSENGTMTDMINRIFEESGNNDNKEDPKKELSNRVSEEVLKIMPNEIKKKLPNRNISFKQRPQKMHKRTTAKIYENPAAF